MIGTSQLINAFGGPVCFTDTLNIFGADAAYSSNIALYQFADNANDTTGNYNGTASNITYTSGKFGNAGVFNGSSSRVSLPDGSFRYTAFTATAWIKQDAQDASDIILENYDYQSSTSRGFIFRVSSAKLEFSGYYSDAAVTSAASSASIPLNTWTHVAVVLNSSASGVAGIKLFINGSEVTYSARAWNGIQYHTTCNATIGSLTYGGGSTEQFYSGNIDQVRVFSKALSDTEIATIYAETSSTASSTNPLSEGAGVALYSMDYDASEASGNYDGAPTDVNFGVEGKSNHGAKFNGSSSKIDLGNQTFLNSGDWSISFWMKSQGNDSNFQYLVSQRVGSEATSPVNIGFYGVSYSSNPGKLNFNVSNSYFTSTSALTKDTWYHVVFTIVAGGAMKIYINGNLDASGTEGGTRSTPTTQNLAIGSNGSNTDYPFNGSIDQVRIFRKAISATEVSQLYGNGAGEIACVYTATADNINYPVTNLAYYKLDNSAEDEKGSHDATADVTYAFGRFGQAAVFDGASNGSQILIPDAAAFSPANNDLSFSVWVKTTSTSGGYVLTKQNDGTGIYETQFYMNTNGTVVLTLYTSGGSAVASVTTTATVNDGNWHHLAFVIDTNTSVSVYVDTVGVTSSSWSGTMSDTAADVGLGFGGTGMAANRFAGSLDQVRFFATALSASQITKLYNEKPESPDTSNFKTVLYEGASPYVSNVGFQPDLLWVKGRDFVSNNRLFDSVRGASAGSLKVNGDDAEATASGQRINSFEANGFIAPSEAGDINQSSQDFVAWCWKAGGKTTVDNTASAGSAPTLGSVMIDGVASTASLAGTIAAKRISANTAAGFSIIRNTGTADYTATIAHGLSAAPELVIQKTVSSAVDWYVLFNIDGTGAWDYAKLNTTAAFGADSPQRFATSSTTINNWGWTGYDMINYCWHSVAGYSKIGTYTGSGSSGKSVTGLGFKPNWVMTKNTNDADTWDRWYIQDSVRGGGAVVYASDTNAEAAYTSMQFDADGFTLNTNDTGINESGDTYIYMAFK